MSTSFTISGSYVSRRSLMAGAMVAAGTSTIGANTPVAVADPRRAGGTRGLLEADLFRLRRLQARGRLTARELTRFYLDRIDKLNPTLGAVIETNPDALRIAARRDAERAAGYVRGPLHGIPVIVKDNIATRDRMQTTAGSLALVGSQVPADAPVVKALRRAGAIVLGKANLTEWANFRGGSEEFPPINGWSARGGFTRNPYHLGIDPCGSSSGSAAAAAANLCAVAVGTETDGSIICPSGEQSLVGIKPTVGLVAQHGIIPIAASQDTAGPMTRTVADAATLLTVLRTPFGPVAGKRLPRDYRAFLYRRRALRGMRLAIDLRYTDGDFGVDPDRRAVFDSAVDAMRGAGAVVDEVTTPDPTVPIDGRVPFDDELTVLLFEFKVGVNEYLAGLRRTPVRTLEDLIAFNSAECAAELKYYGQELFEQARATSDLSDPEYRAAAAVNRRFGQSSIDSVLAQGYHAVIWPSFGFGSSPAATAGYPSMTVPIGFTGDSTPVGLGMSASFLGEPALIRLGSATEDLLRARRQPELLGEVPPEPALFPGCDATPSDGAVTKKRSQDRAGREHDRMRRF
jgi:amidase